MVMVMSMMIMMVMMMMIIMDIFHHGYRVISQGNEALTIVISIKVTQTNPNDGKMMFSLCPQ